MFAEMAVLAAILLEPSALEPAMDVLDPSMFAWDEHRRVFEAMLRLREAGEPTDPIMVADALSCHGDLDRVGGYEYLALLLDAIPTGANVRSHAGLVRREAGRRRVVCAAQAIIAGVMGSGSEPADLAGQAEESFSEIRRAFSPSLIALPVLNGAELLRHQGTALPYVISGLIPAGRQGVLFGSPGVGKSTLARHMVLSILAGCAVLGRWDASSGTCLWITAEETPDDLGRGLGMCARGSGLVYEEVADGLTVVALRDEDFTLCTPGSRQVVEALIERLRPTLIVLDSMANLAGVDLKDDVELTPVLRWGAQVSSRHGPSVLWLAHDNKNQEKNDLDRLFGSRQASALMDFAYRMVSEGATSAKLRTAKMRGAAGVGEVHLSVHTDPDRALAISATEGVFEEAGPSRLIDGEIEQYLNEFPGANKSELRDTVAKRLNKRAGDVGDRIEALVHQGTLRVERVGKANKHYLARQSLSEDVRESPDQCGTPEEGSVPTGGIPPVGRSPTGHTPPSSETEPRPSGSRDRCHREGRGGLPTTSTESQT